MRVVFDVEANALVRPTKIWVVVLKDIDKGEYHIFRNITDSPQERERFLNVASTVDTWIGHNSTGYDLPVLRALVPGFCLRDDSSPLGHCDTLILSKLINYSRQGHSLEDYGLEFGFEKIKFNDFSKYSADMETYCIRDVDLTHRVYNKFHRFISNDQWHSSIDMEHAFGNVVNSLRVSGFGFQRDKAERLLGRVNRELDTLDVQIKEAFPPREVLIREFTPKATKFGTISRSSVPRSLLDRIHTFEVGKPYRHTRTEDFNPSSHKQLIQVLHDAGWKPVNKTTTHIQTERELNRLRYSRELSPTRDEDSKLLRDKLEKLQISGWKIDEDNLNTLPAGAPAPARLLAKRIMLESRRRTLTEWLGLVQEDGRIHGDFYGIGAWTHRMAHQHPNTANIPTDAKLFGGEMRSLWCAPKNRLLVGVDAEGIQLRIFAHYIDDPDFTKSLVEGKKDEKSDPHSLNQRIIGAKSRNIAKRFIFAYLLGAGVGKLAQILEVHDAEARLSLDRLLERYSGLQFLKETIIPGDAKRGYFRGLDGRLVRIPGDTPGERKHLCMSGYLQNGEAVVMKKACLRWASKLKDYGAFLVNFVHDEWQIECPNNMETALTIANLCANSLKEVGEELGLKCPLAGSFWNDDLKDYTIGTNWKVTH